MNSDFQPGERVLVDRSIPAEFVGYSGGHAIIRIGVDTRLVDPVVLTRQEA